jgi:ERI1 exoribonuclease 2
MAWIGTSLMECLEMFHVWLARHDLLPRPESRRIDGAAEPRSFWLVTWSDWDLGTMLDGQCMRTGLDKEAYFGQWVDLKQLYMRYYNMKFRFLLRSRDEDFFSFLHFCFSNSLLSNRVKLAEAVCSLGLRWEGQEHCALDDCRNTSRLLSKIIEHGHRVNITTTLSGPQL